MPRLQRSMTVRGIRQWFDDEDLRHEPVSAAEHRILATVRPETKTDGPALLGLIKAVQYVNQADVPGALVECGVYRGGSSMAMALQCVDDGRTDRDLYLYDTFDGCPAPTAADGAIFDGQSAQELWDAQLADTSRRWFEEVEFDARTNLESTGYPMARVQMVRGLVEETIPAVAPDQIALLRLDTDWYSSTRHEMAHLYPRLAPGGVIVVDDYGWFESARRAFEEYFVESGDQRPLMHRLNVTVRIGVKPG